jgi:hypothetical protein
LIGEGALHIVAAIHARGLVLPGGAVVPAGATLFAQPGRLLALGPRGASSSTSHLLALASSSSSSQLDRIASAADPYTYRPGQYSAVDLDALERQGRWEPLAPPQRVFAFSFADGEAAVAAVQGATETLLEFEVAQEDAEVNAVAFFFALDMGGEGEMLLSSARPAGGDDDNNAAAATVASSWKQAVQRLCPLKCGPSAPLRVIAKHDTYGVTFEWAGETIAPRPPGARALDEAVAAADTGLGASLARAVAQDPLAYRRLARAAVRLALTQEEGASAVGAVAVARLLA